jgi:hypothetical protein
MASTLSFFVLPPPCAHASSSSPSAAQSSSAFKISTFKISTFKFSAFKFSHRPHSDSGPVSLPSGVGSHSNIQASSSRQKNTASQRPARHDTERDTLRADQREAFDAAFTRSGYILPQSNLSQTSASPCSRHDGPGFLTRFAATAERKA